jgi:hypothetical protein
VKLVLAILNPTSPNVAEVLLDVDVIVVADVIVKVVLDIVVE